MKQQVKSICGNVLFEYDSDTTSLKEALEERVRRGAYLSGAYLSGAYLRGAYLRGADLYGADLRGADLRGADLRGAYLRGADLYGANLRGADLRGAYLRGADLRGADLRGADLRGADLYGADLTLEDVATLYGRTTHLSTGEIDGYKKVKNHIIKLIIPRDAERIHGIGSRKCRASKAIVVSITSPSGESVDSILNSGNDWSDLLYKVGETVIPDLYDGNPLVECSHGINFFISEIEAKEY